MKIGFDARMIDHPGIGRYISNLLSAMLELNTGDEFLIFGNIDKLSAFSFQLSDKNLINWDAPVYSLKEQLSQPFNSYDLDILHVPHFNAPVAAGKGAYRLVVTIHDLIYTKFPGYLPIAKRVVAKFLIKNSTKKADGIIVVSGNTKNDILEFDATVKGKIRVIHEAADPVFNTTEDSKKLNDVRQKYRLSENFILFVGSLRKHKNIIKLLDAFAILKKKGMAHDLVIIGRPNPKEPEVLDNIEKSDAIYLGEVPTEDLAFIYNLASLLVMPSLYEGFGLHILEAFASGVAVAASGVSSIPEIAQDAAVLFDPLDANSISDAMHKVLSDEMLMNSLAEKGLKRAKEFSWQRTAEKTLETYKEVTTR